MPRFSARSNFALLPQAKADQAEAEDLDPDEDNGEGLPSPHMVKVSARRMAGLREATEALDKLPGPGESLHVVSTARLDLTDTLAALMVKLSAVSEMRIATLGYNEKNLAALLEWLDEGAVKTVSLVASLFFRAHKRGLWETTLKQFRQRKQRAACCHSHSKVVTLHFASGVKMSIEGIANLCGNGSGREQFALFNDPALHDWHSAWIGELLDRHEWKEAERKQREQQIFQSNELQLPGQPPPVLVLDATGVGAAVVEMVRESMMLAKVRGNQIAVTITAGSEWTCLGNGHWRVAKFQLASILMSVIGGRRWHVADVLERETLIREAQNFSVKITQAGNETFESWRESEHDDLVLALALGLWAAECIDWKTQLPWPPPPRSGDVHYA
jgi:hypothetical protein